MGTNVTQVWVQSGWRSDVQEWFVKAVFPDPATYETTLNGNTTYRKRELPGLIFYHFNHTNADIDVKLTKVPMVTL